MSNFFISLLLSAGVGGWLYFIFAKQTGEGNTKPAVIGAVAAAIVLFVVAYLTLGAFIRK